MLHAKSCGCCGCKRIGILRNSPFEGTLADWLNANRNLAQYDTALVDGEGPVYIECVAANWQLKNDSVAGGQIKVDLNASTVALAASWVPQYIPGERLFVYNASYSPTTTSTATASLYDGPATTYTVELVARNLPSDALQNKPLHYDENADDPVLFESSPPVSQSHLRLVSDSVGADAQIFSLNAHVYTVPQNQTLVSGVSIYDGQPIKRLVQSFHDFPEPAQGNLPANPGTPLSEFQEWTNEGIESWMCYIQPMSFRGKNDGCAAREKPPEGSFDPALGGYDAKITIHVGSETRLVNQVARVADYDPGTVRESPLSAPVTVCSYATTNDDRFPDTAFVTAYVDRGSDAHPYGGTGYIVYRGSGSIDSLKQATVWRDGEQVFQGTFPANNPSSDFNAACAPQGSYLIAIEEAPEQNSDGSPKVVGLINHLPLPPSVDGGLTKTFQSSVNDLRQPVIGFVPLSDIYGGVYAPKTKAMFSTRPLQSGCAADEGNELRLTRPKLDVQLYPSGQLNQGTHSMSLRASLTDQPYKDEQNNFPTGYFSVPFTVHAPPPANREGVWPTLEDPGLQTREHWRARLNDEPVVSLRLSFSRKIAPAGVSLEQFTLEQSIDDSMTEVQGGIAIEPVGDGAFEWNVSLTAIQPEATFFVLTYDPAGDVFTDDVTTETYRTENDFPPPEQSRYKVIYHAKATDAFWSKSPSGYVSIAANSPPLDQDGVPYNPEPAVLATRVGWLMADMSGYYKKIDCTPEMKEIGRIASVGSQQTIDAKKDQTLVGTTGDVVVPQSIGTYSPLTNFDGYTPGVPALTDPADDSSYWGLTTTIDPSPPAKVSACAAPRVAQRHASAIRCNGDIESLTVTFQPYDGPTYTYNRHHFGTPSGFYNVADGNFALKNADFYYPFFQQNTQNACNDAAIHLLAKQSFSATFGKSLSGAQMSQNVWSHVSGSTIDTVDIAESLSRIDGFQCDGQTWYGVQLVAPAQTFSVDDVYGWPVKPGFQHGTVFRGRPDGGTGGFDVQPDKYEPGDREPHYPFRQIAWWSDRKPPFTRNDYSYNRGSASGRIRRMSGTMSIKAVQGTLSAFRSACQYPALKTTTLGQLKFRLSLRVAVTANVHYEERTLQETVFFGRGYVPSYLRCQTFTIEDMINSRSFYPNLEQFTLDGWLNSYRPTSFGASADTINYRGTWEGASGGDSRTLNHTFLQDVDTTFALTKQGEEMLANGQELDVRMDGIPLRIRANMSG